MASFLTTSFHWHPTLPQTVLWEQENPIGIFFWSSVWPEQASRTRSPACLCLCDEIGLLHPSELGQKTALLDILSSFQEVLPDCQSLLKTCLLIIVFWPWLWWITSFALMCLTPFCLKWWTLPALQLSIEFLWHLLIDLIAFHIVYNHIPVTHDLILLYKQFSVTVLSPFILFQYF